MVRSFVTQCLLAGCSLAVQLGAQVEVGSNGNVGIGTTSPQAALDMGSATGGRALTWSGSSGDGRYLLFLRHTRQGGGIVLATGFHGDGATDSYLSSYTGSMSRSTIRLNAFGESAGSIQFLTNTASAVTAGDPITPTERMRITASGNVGIATSPGHKLQVAGSVRATSFISDTTTYADFVFSSDYKLPEIREVEAHILDKGHLPGIPSEAEARANVIDLAAMQVKLLQKIEELTLHEIAQEKEMQAMRAEIS